MPYQAFHVVFPDNRHLIPPAVSVPTGIREWERYPSYDFPPTVDEPDCVNPGSRNTDVLTAKVNAELVLSAPTTYKQGSPGDPTWGYPITVFNQSGGTRFFRLEIIEEAGMFASFVVDPANPGIQRRRGKQLLGRRARSSPTRAPRKWSFVDPGATEQIRIKVQGVDCTVAMDENGDYTYDCGDPDGEHRLRDAQPRPEQPGRGRVRKAEPRHHQGGSRGIRGERGRQCAQPLRANPFVRNPFVRNPFVRNPFVRNTAIDDQTDLYKVIDTTWSVQATEDSGAGSYLPVINIDNAERFVDNYAFQLLDLQERLLRSVRGLRNLQHRQPRHHLERAQSPEIDAANPFVRNPFVRNPFVRNPFVRNPFVRNSAITVAPAEGVYETTQSSATHVGTKNLIDENGVLRVPRLPEKVFITLRAFQIADDATIAASGFEFNPFIDEPAISAVPTRCTTDDCIKSLAPNLVPTDFSGAPAEIALGDTFSVSVSLANQGTVEAEAENRALRHGVYLSADDTVAFGPESDTPTDGDKLVSYPDAGPETYPLVTPTEPPLAAGDSDTFDDVTLTISELPNGCSAGGDCYLIFVVDDYREVSESNETDNQTAINVAIIDPNAPPVAFDQSVITDEDTPVAITLTASDPDGDELTYVLVSGPSNGSLTGTEPNLTYTPGLDFNGTDTFTYTASDGEDTDTGTVTITVLPVADYVFDGFFKPWTEEPPYSANAGRAIPLMWRYLDETGTTVVDSSGFDPTITSTFYDTTGSVCPGYVEGEGVTEEITLDPDDPGSSELRYSASSKEWQLNWATPEIGGCYYLRVFNNGPGVSEPLLIVLE